jgi:pimeloyl-ACP methyl ester carboxylesterase
MRGLALSLLALLCTGCVSSILARKVVAPPNQSGIKPLFADLELLRHARDAYAANWSLDVGPPPARLELSAVEPGDYGFAWNSIIEYPEGKAPRIKQVTASWRPAYQARRIPARGTVLLLHGYLQNRDFMVPWAVRLAEAGYRCVLVDLRGHGASTGKHISFGAFEARDLVQVLDDLQSRGWDVSRIGILGVSYGASVGLVTAGRDPRVAAVVALQPFASAQRAVPELMRGAFAAQARGISDRQFAAAHAKEAEIAGFDWASADIPAALARTRAPVLFIHGERDDWVSPAHSRELLRAAPAGSHRVTLPRDTHVSLPFQVSSLGGEIVAWFDANLRGR